MKTFILNISREEYGGIKVKAKNEDEARAEFMSGDLWDEINWNKENIEIQNIDEY